MRSGDKLGEPGRGGAGAATPTAYGVARGWGLRRHLCPPVRRLPLLTPAGGSPAPMEPVQVPDADAFRAFQAQCEAERGWQSRYSREGVGVWVQPPAPAGPAVHTVKCRIDIQDVPAETVYDVLHDIEYRRKWDMNVIDTHDIARLAANADVGYYAWKCPKPLKNRDVVTLRSWQVVDKSYMIINFSVKHAQYPPRKDLVRTVSILAGYLVQSTGSNSCTLTYLAQVDPKGIHLGSLCNLPWRRSCSLAIVPWETAKVGCE
nr:START domain-containing protein 10-like isoform X1 [Caretta caretta]